MYSLTRTEVNNLLYDAGFAGVFRCKKETPETNQLKKQMRRLHSHDSTKLDETNVICNHETGAQIRVVGWSTWRTETEKFIAEQLQIEKAKISVEGQLLLFK